MLAPFSRIASIPLFAALLVSILPADRVRAADPADIYEQLPGDAHLVFIARNLQSINDKIAAIAKRRGSEKQWKQEALNPLKALREAFGVKNGLRADGDAALAMWVQPKIQMEMLILVPVTDYEQFLGNFPAGDVQGDLREITIANSKLWCGKRGGHAAIALQPDTLRRQAPATKLPASYDNTLKLDLAYLTRTQDFMKALAGENPMQIVREQALVNFDNPPANWPDPVKKLCPVLKPLVVRALDVYMAMALGASTQAVGLSLSDDGVRYRMHYGFGPKTDAGQLIGSLKNTEEPLLTNLPDEKYVGFGGIWLGDRGATLPSQFLDPVIDQWKTQGDDAKPLLDLAHAVVQAATPMRSISFGVQVQPRKDQKPNVRGAIVINGDSRLVVLGIRNTAIAANTLLNQLKTGVKIETAQSAVRIGDVSFDRLKITGLPPGEPELFINAGAIDAQTTLVTVAMDSGWLEKAARSARDGKNAMNSNAGVRAVDAMLPKSRLAVVYMSPAEFLQMVEMIDKKEMPKLPPDLAPTGIAVSSVDSDLRIDGAVPQPTSDILIDLFVTKVVGPPQPN